MTNQQPKNLPQYYQGTPGEVKLAAFLKNHDYLTKSHFDQIINFFRASEYLSANVVNHFITDIHPSPPAGVFNLSRRRRDNAVILSLRSVVDDTKTAVVAEFVDIPALNLVASTIKRICNENGLIYIGRRDFNNVIVYDFYGVGAHQHKTTLSISVDKEYNDYVNQTANKAGSMADTFRPKPSVHEHCPEEPYGGLRL